jgi:Tfp pilus assembly protein PilO
MKASSREMVLMWATGLVALGGLTYIVCEPRLREWKSIEAKQIEAARKLEVTRHLVAQEPKWNAKLSELRKKLPQYPPEKDVTADLLIKIEQLANAHSLSLPSRDMEKETQKGDMYELAANCKWEGKLEALVRFLFDLQQEDAILGISQLSITPNEKKVLRGSFTVYCSYSRNQPPGSRNQPPGGKGKKPETKVSEQ